MSARIGRPPLDPTDTNRQLHIILPTRQYRQLRYAAIGRDTTASGLVRQLILDFLTREVSEEPGSEAA